MSTTSYDVNRTTASGKGAAATNARSNTGSGSESSAAASSVTHEQIAARAREIWKTKGCPEGQDKQNWCEAEAQLRAEARRSR